jgi:hypothetical protein
MYYNSNEMEQAAAWMHKLLQSEPSNVDLATKLAILYNTFETKSYFPTINNSRSVWYFDTYSMIAYLCYKVQEWITDL